MADKLEIWDPHFHIWDVGADTESGHELEQLLAVNGKDVYAAAEYEADFLPATDFEHTGGAWLEAVSVCHVGLSGPQYDAYCLAEANWSARELQKSDLNYVLIPTAPLHEPNVADTLAQLAEIPRVHGIRQIVNHDPDWPRNAVLGDLLDNPQWQKGYAELQKHAMSFDLQLNAPQFKKAATFMKDFPDTPVIINHLGSPTLGDVTERERLFRDGLEALAGCPQAYIKISMLFYTTMDWDQCEPLINNINWIIDTFGVDRCVFASNYPVDIAQGWTADRLYGAFRKIAEAKTDLAGQQKLFAGNAKRVYRAE